MNGKEWSKVVRGLMDACNELMTEFVSQKRAADWEIINDGMVAGEDAIRKLKTDSDCTHVNQKRVKRNRLVCTDCHTDLTSPKAPPKVEILPIRLPASEQN